MKQVKPASGTVPSSTAAPAVGEEGQPAGEVGPIVVVAEVFPSAHSFVLAKRKRDDNVAVSGRKKSKAFMSLHELRQVVGLTLDSGCPSSLQDLPFGSISHCGSCSCYCCCCYFCSSTSSCRTCLGGYSCPWSWCAGYFSWHLHPPLPHPCWVSVW